MRAYDRKLRQNCAIGLRKGQRKSESTDLAFIPIMKTLYVSSLLIICFCVHVSLQGSTSGSDLSREGESNQASTSTSLPLVFPSSSQQQEELTSLHSLVESRPGVRRRSSAAQAFKEDFANHPSVAKIDLYKAEHAVTAQEFANLRGDQKDPYWHLKMTAAIRGYLDDKAAPLPIKDAILGFNYKNRRTMQRKRFVSNSKATNWKRYRFNRNAVVKKIEERKRQQEGQGVVEEQDIPLKVYMNKAYEPEELQGLSASELEKKARRFEDKYNHNNRSGFARAITTYLKEQKFTNLEIEVAMGVRSRDLALIRKFHYHQRHGPRKKIKKFMDAEARERARVEKVKKALNDEQLQLELEKQLEKEEKRQELMAANSRALDQIAGFMNNKNPKRQLLQTSITSAIRQDKQQRLAMQLPPRSFPSFSQSEYHPRRVVDLELHDQDWWHARHF